MRIQSVNPCSGFIAVKTVFAFEYEWTRTDCYSKGCNNSVTSQKLGPASQALGLTLCRAMPQGVGNISASSPETSGARWVKGKKP